LGIEGSLTTKFGFVAPALAQSVQVATEVLAIQSNDDVAQLRCNRGLLEGLCMGAIDDLRIAHTAGVTVTVEDDSLLLAASVELLGFKMR
jgi:hypothetical protein